MLTQNAKLYTVVLQAKHVQFSLKNISRYDFMQKYDIITLPRSEILYRKSIEPTFVFQVCFIRHDYFHP